MIHDIFPHVYDNAYRHTKPSEDDFVLRYEDNMIFVKDENRLFRVKDFKNTSLIYLFQIDERRYYLSNEDIANALSFPIHHYRNFPDPIMSFAIVTGYHIDAWMKVNRYCGRCAHPNVIDQEERAMRCPSCGNIVYPRIMPAIIVAVKNDKDQLLVTKYARGIYQKYALVAGFNEIGETIEETCVREVKEETGLDITDLKYFASQPWGFSSSLLFGFVAKVKGNDTICLDEKELRLAKWVDRDEEIETGGNASLTSKLIQEFQKGNI